jgi:methionine-rich copper-binding protein CopC
MAASLLSVEPNETIDQAQDLGVLSQPAEALGSIGNGPAGAADVTWYHFKLVDPARVDLDISTPAGDPPFASVLSLYNNDPQDFGDPYDLDGHRLLAQVQADPSDGAAGYSQDLGPGDYFVAISGAGDLDFSPLIAGSGFDGATGSYELMIRATDLGLSGSGPTVLSSDPAAGAVLDSSPLAIRLEMSGPLDPNTILPGQTVQLFSSSDNGSGSSVALASVNFSTTAAELQLFPLAPLGPGNYVIQLTGDSSTGQPVLADPDGVPLGEDAGHPSGADESFAFQVAGIDGVAGATGSDDTASSARDLGNVAGAGLIQVSGAIGDDPSFNPSLSPDPTNPESQFVPANQVDLYHFRISGPGRYMMLAEVFAGRIGSPLAPGISLWEQDPSDGTLVFLAGNIDTLNPTQGTDGSIPLFTDSALTDGLTAGDYYLAVAGGSNTPCPVEGQIPGTPGIVDPNQPGSAQLGWSTGPYVLNFLVQPAPNPPQVLTSSPSSGQVLDQAPTQLTVQFSEPINIQQLAFQAFETSYQATLPQVYIEGTDGTRYYPRFLSYDRATNQATFQMLDGLANGQYTLHLSGPGGLTDFGGNPLAGNDPSGDYVIPFQVQGPDRDISGNMTDGYTVQSGAGQGVPQDLGVLFPRELQAGVTVIRGPESGNSPASATTADEYVIQLLQNQEYSVTLSGDDLPGGVQVTVSDASGQTVPLLTSNDGLVNFAPLSAGTYTVGVGGWTAGSSNRISYQLTIDLLGQQDNAPPLVDGPAPLLQIHLDTVGGNVVPIATDGPGGSNSTGAGATGAGGSVGSENDGPVSVSLPGATGPGPAGDGVPGPDRGVSVSLPGATGSGLTHDGTVGSLASLGVSPLGGVGGESGPGASAAPIQVALGLPTTPVFNSLVSLITLTQVISVNREGEGIEAVENPLEQPVADASDGPRSDLPVEVALSIGRPDSPEHGASTIERVERAGLPVPVRLAAQSGLTSNDPVPLGQEIPPRAADAVVDRVEPELMAGIGVTRLVITGAIVSAAFFGRRAIRDLKWIRRARAERPRSAGPIGRRLFRGSKGVTWPPSEIGCALPHELRRAPQPAGSSRSQDAR